MPRTVVAQFSFGTGEVTPSLYGRVDIAKYGQGMKSLLNYLPEPEGGVNRRPGTRYVATVKDSAKRTRLLPFQFSVSQAYILELGDLYIRFHKNSAPLLSNDDLIVNGAFDSNITNWTTAGPGLVTWDSLYGGSMRLFGLFAAPASGRQDATVTPMTAYTLQFQLPEANVQCEVLVGSTSGGSDLLNATLATGTYSYTLTSPTALMSITFRVQFGDVAYVDNVSLRVASGVVEVVTPYTEADIFGLDIKQVADVVYFLHERFPVHKLERYSDTLWKFRQVTFTPPPSFEFGARPVATVTAGGLTGSQTFTSSVDAFLASDVGREILITGGVNAGARATITAFGSRQSVTAAITQAFVDTNPIAAGNWKLTASPVTAVTVGDKDPVGKSVTLTLVSEGWRGFTSLGDSDCGRIAVINGGSFEITRVTSRTVAQATIRGVASSVTQAEARSWSLEEALWSALNGYPECGAFFQDRFALDADFKVALSKNGDYENFGVGILDDDAVIDTANTGSGRVDSIRNMLALDKKLVLLTAGGEVTMEGSTDAPLSPSNGQVSSRTTLGSNGVPALRVNAVGIFVGASGKAVYEYVDSFEANGFVGVDLLLLASHLTEDRTIIEMAYEKDPARRIWAVGSDGVLLCCTYLRDQNVVAWSHHITGVAQDGSDGQFESVAVIPHPDGDREQVWVVVKRTKPGGTVVRYVEYLDDSPLYYDRRMTDAAIVYGGVATTSITGLSALNGFTVAKQIDGADGGQVALAADSITLAEEAEQVEVGIPFIPEGETLTPEVPIGGQTSQFMKRRWVRLICRVKDTVGLQLRGSSDGRLEDIPWRLPSTPPGDPPPTRSGDFERTNLGWGDGRITFRQPAPLPSNILMVGGVLEIGDA